jgi:hypothetical protein
MTIEADRLSGRKVVLTQPGTGASDANRILGTAVAAHTTDRVETGAAIRAVEKHGEVRAAVAGIAIAIQHRGAAMDVVGIVSPGLAVAERNVGRGPEISVTPPTVGIVSSGGVLRVGLSGSHPDHEKTEKNHERLR